MPKIIENIRERLLCEAKKQILENGYAKTTIRSVALACELGTGTVYNYFKSKDHLIATFMAEDWLSLINKIKTDSTEDGKEVLRNIFNTLLEFTIQYKSLFSDKDAEKVFVSASLKRHKLLRDQLAEIIAPICNKDSIKNSIFMSEYIAESLLTWTVAGKSFEEQYEILSKLLK